MRVQWEEGLAREGLIPVAHAVPVGPNSAGEVACPACGTVGPLVEGACGDCGLILG